MGRDLGVSLRLDSEGFTRLLNSDVNARERSILPASQFHRDHQSRILVQVLFLTLLLTFVVPGAVCKLHQHPIDVHVILTATCVE